MDAIDRFLEFIDCIFFSYIYVIYLHAPLLASVQEVISRSLGCSLAHHQHNADGCPAAACMHGLVKILNQHPKPQTQNPYLHSHSQHS